MRLGTGITVRKLLTAHDKREAKNCCIVKCYASFIDSSYAFSSEEELLESTPPLPASVLPLVVISPGPVAADPS